jgi:hypothetical protein
MKDESLIYQYNPYTQTKCPKCNANFSIECFDNPDKNDIYDEIWICNKCKTIVGKTINC